MGKIYQEGFTADDSRKWGLLCLLAGLIIYFLSQKYLRPNSASVLSLFVALIIFTIRVYWNLRQRTFFWLTMSLVSSIDAAIVYLFPDGKWLNALIVLAPLAAAHVIVSVCFLKVAESITRKMTRES